MDKRQHGNFYFYWIIPNGLITAFSKAWGFIQEIKISGVSLYKSSYAIYSQIKVYR